MSLEMVDGVVTVTYCHAVSRRVANTGGYLVCDHMPDSQCRLGTGERQLGDGPEVVLGGPVAAAAEGRIKTEWKY